MLKFELVRLKRNISMFKKTCLSLLKGKEVKFYFAIKANENELIRKIIFSENFGAEILSLKELYQTPKNVNFIVNGHYKSDLFLKESLTRGVEIIFVETFSEAKKLNQLALEQKMSVNVGLRVKVDDKKRIGIGLEEVDFFLSSELLNLNFTAVSFHVGWNNTNDELYSQAIQRALLVGHKLKTLGWNIKKLNVGGSFIEPSIDPSQLVSRLKIIKKLCPEWIQEILFEPGRYLVGDCGFYLADVVSINSSEIQLNSACYLHKLTGATPRVSLKVLKKPHFRRPVETMISFSGHWPSENDKLESQDIKKNPIVGDQIILHNLGAYMDDLMSQLNLDKNISWDFRTHLSDLKLNEEEEKFVLKYWDFDCDKFLGFPSQLSQQRTICKILTRILDNEMGEVELSDRLLLYVEDPATIRREMFDSGYLDRVNGRYFLKD